MATFSSIVDTHVSQ